MDERRAPEPIILGSESTHDRARYDVSLEEILELVCNGVAGSSVAEITLLESKQQDLAVAIDQVASGGAAIPFRDLGGPRLDAYRRHVINRIDSIVDDLRWPEFCRSAAAVGINSVLSFPLVFSGVGLGTLSVYSEVEAGFDDRAERVGAIFAPLTSAIVGSATASLRRVE